MVNDNCPDILGICETFLNNTPLENQVAIAGFDLIRKDRAETQDKKWWRYYFIFKKHIEMQTQTKSRNITIRNYKIIIWKAQGVPQ